MNHDEETQAQGFGQSEETRLLRVRIETVNLKAAILQEQLDKITPKLDRHELWLNRVFGSVATLIFLSGIAIPVLGWLIFKKQ